jgi:hypothetical protein
MGLDFDVSTRAWLSGRTVAKYDPVKSGVPSVEVGTSTRTSLTNPSTFYPGNWLPVALYTEFKRRLMTWRAWFAWPKP